MTQGSLVKEFHKLLKNVSKMSDGQAAVSEWVEEDVTTFKIQIKPHGGAYRGGTFYFMVTLGDEFPEDPPKVRCETPIYHPNIDPTEDNDDTNICINMFNTDEWQEGYGIGGVIQGLLFLFYQPNLEDPLSPYFDGTAVEEFEENVLLSLKGKTVEGFKFPWNYDGEREEDEDAEEDNDGMNENTKTKNDNADGKCEESTSDKVANRDDENVGDGHEILKGECSSENTCAPELCNGNDTSIKDLSTAKTAEENVDNPYQEVPKGSGSGIPFKPKEHIAQASVISPSDNDQPDVIPLSSDDCSASCPPDVVTMTTDNSSRSQESFYRDFKTLSVQRRVSDICVLDKVTGRHAVSLYSFDSSIPEMNLVFTMLNKVTESVNMWPILDNRITNNYL